jgi:hypothetical protein
MASRKVGAALDNLSTSESKKIRLLILVIQVTKKLGRLYKHNINVNNRQNSLLYSFKLML